MYPVPSQCPICDYHLIVTEVACDRCASVISGRFSLGRLHRLTPEQLQFIEVFILCEGKINRVEQELGMSYPAVRSQLQEVIRALGQDPAEASQPPAPPQRPEAPRYQPPQNTPPAPPTVPAPPPPPAVSDDKRREILARVSAGEISAQEAASLLRKTT